MVRSFTENVAKLPGEVGVGPKQNWQTAAENFPSGENHPATASRRVTEGSGEAANSAATPSTAAESQAETRAGSRRRPAGRPRTARPHHTAEDRMQPTAFSSELEAKTKTLQTKLYGEKWSSADLQC